MRNYITIGKLKEIIKDMDDNMVVCTNVLGSYHPAHVAYEDEYYTYKIDSNGVPEGKEKCLKIT